MKTLKKIKQMLFVLLLITVSMAYASSVIAMPDVLVTGPQTAKISSSKDIVLDASKSVSEEYSAGISTLNFTSQADADKYFNSISDNLVSYKADFSKGTVKIHLMVRFS